MPEPTSVGPDSGVPPAGPTSTAAQTRVTDLLGDPWDWYTVREGQGGEDSPNYYVIVPATTFQTAERVMREVGSMFDCHVISAAAVDQDAPLLGSA